MLSRTADSLFWTGRYMERADFVARVLDAALRMAALPAATQSKANEWASVLASAADAAAFHAAHPIADERSVCIYLLNDAGNPSSVRSCIARARANARIVRTALTIEVWQAINDAWHDVRRLAPAPDRAGCTRHIEAAKAVTLACDGAIHRTMLRGEAYWFLRLGAALECADNTARLLDVKYHLLLPEGEQVGGGLDYFQWTTILREVSALTAYRWVYRDNIKPWLVADLLILNQEMPRSLASCYATVVRMLDQIADATGRRGPAQRIANATLNRLTSRRIDDIYQSGMHEFITEFLAENNRLGTAIAEQYLA